MQSNRKGTGFGIGLFFVLIVGMTMFAISQLAPEGSNAQKIGAAIVQGWESVKNIDSTKLGLVRDETEYEFTDNFIKSSEVAGVANGELEIILCEKGYVEDDPSYTKMKDGYCYRWYSINFGSYAYDQLIDSDQVHYWQLVANFDKDMTTVTYTLRTEAYEPTGNEPWGVAQYITEKQFNDLRDKLNLPVN